MRLTIDWLRQCPKCSMTSRATTKVCPGCGYSTKSSSQSKNNHKHPTPSLSEEQILKIIKLYNAGISIIEIARKIDNKLYVTKDMRPNGAARITFIRISNLTRGRLHKEKYFHKIIGKEKYKELKINNIFINSYEVRGECWQWLRSSWLKFMGGRGSAARYSYQQKYGPILSTERIIHACDNPKCINPEHLKKLSYEEFTKNFLQGFQNPESIKKARKFHSDKAIKFLTPYQQKVYDWALSSSPKKKFTVRNIREATGFSKGTVEIITKKLIRAGKVERIIKGPKEIYYKLIKI